MRRFSSYGPINNKLHYYAPRQDLIEKAHKQLIGDDPDEGGHYITIWAPRQTGKTWVMQQVVGEIKQDDQFEVGIITLQSAKAETTDDGVFNVFIKKLSSVFKRELPKVHSWKELFDIFTNEYFQKPVVLVIDEFDALQEDFINKFANEFRDMYISRQNETDKKSKEKECLLHGLALIGVRSVLGIENVTGSPFNVQRSIHIPNLSFEEVDHIYKWYEKDSGQKFEQEVIEKIYYEFKGQPGLTCWFGEMLTEGFDELNISIDKLNPITIKNFEETYAAAVSILPNNNILNIISKAKQKPYIKTVLKLFRTDSKINFKYDDPNLNFLYMNGVIDQEKVGTTEYYVKFSSPYVQRRLFNYFSDTFFSDMGQLVEPFESLKDVITEKSLNVKNLMRRYEVYLKKNREWLLKDAPKRKDLRIFEAVYHFNLFTYLHLFLTQKKAEVYPEFPTGNGKIDIIVKYNNNVYGIEVKSFSDEGGYTDALSQAAQYGRQLMLSKISLVFFVEYVDDANRKKYETEYIDNKTGIKVLPIFVETGK